MSRISELPRRDWETSATPELVEDLSCYFKTDHGTMRLREVQAVSLAEIHELGGAFLAIYVGGGKTLISGLAPVALDAKRPLVVVPAKLVAKTKHEFEELRLHWKIPVIPVISYQFLSQEKNSNWLFQYQPDCIILDEAHALKTASKKGGAAVAKRFRRYQQHAPSTKFVAMTGTIAKDSITDYAHLIVWCLGKGAPVPDSQEFQELWGSCIDVRKPGQEGFRPSFKVLEKDLGGPIVDLDDARERYAQRLRQTPGVIISTEGYNEVPLFIQPTYAPDIEMDHHWDKLRGGWIAPDDWPLGDAKAQVWAMSRDLSRGFYKYHTPWPPDEWMSARKAWAGFVRGVVEEECTLWDTERQVRTACEEGLIFSEAYLDWMRTQSQHKVDEKTRKAQWLSYDVIEFVHQDVLKKFGNSGGVVWTCQTQFAKTLAKRTGWRYFGEMGLDAQGSPIESAKSNEIVIASIAANGTGRNLQKLWNLNYVTCPPPTNMVWEQLMGRTHRPGQLKDEVRFWVMFACREDIDTFRMAIAEAEFSYRTTKQRFKLLDSDIEMPELGPGKAYD
jgi:hypothetical protein